MQVSQAIPDWMMEARCRDADPEIFFPDRNDAQSARMARAICRSCDVIEECLEFALEEQEEGGIWANTNRVERRVLRLARSAEAC